MRLPFLLLLLSGSFAVHAQPTAVGPWNIGLKLGTGASYSTFSAGHPHPWTAYTGGLSGGYRFKVAGAFLTLQADALVERREVRPWQLASASNSVLFVPLYLRTNRPAARLHFILGGGPTLWLNGNVVPDASRAAYVARQVEATGLAGLEVRLLPFSRYETTVALTYRAGFTPEYIHYRQSLSLNKYYEENEIHSWLGLTLNVYFHPAVRPEPRQQ